MGRGHHNLAVLKSKRIKYETKGSEGLPEPQIKKYRFEGEEFHGETLTNLALL